MINEKILSDEELLDITGGNAFAVAASLDLSKTNTTVCYGVEPPSNDTTRTY